MTEILTTLFFFGIPLAVTVLFAVSLSMLLYARHKNKKAPGSYTEAQIRTRTVLTVISGSAFGVLTTVVLSFIAVLALAIAYM